MTTSNTNSKVYVANSPIHGLGVFAVEDIAAGDIVETCPLIVVPADQVSIIDRTVIYNYYYNWADGSAAIALGAGSLYNHSFGPNADYERDVSSRCIVLWAISDIAKGEEITINYAGADANPSQLWFEAVV